ncbi:alpha/beta fold hydrolase [Leucobacter celer]|uniref:alpha/beta fold hydrolase n=1 Tax=Leucobacter celer TaxID=668625 RepID=UPI0006A7B296|nr:alpha/beta hydrolase [Leucobacter celer]
MGKPEQVSPPRNWRYWSEPERVEVDGSEVAYRRKGSGEPVLFLHGGGLTRRWLPFHEALAGEVDLIAPEHPGFGDSALPAHFRDFGDYALHYDAFLRALDLDGVHLVGTSLGGRIAAHLATVYPERFRSLTLLVPAGLRGSGSRPDPFRQTPDAAMDLLANGRADRLAEEFAGFDYPENVVQGYREDTALALLTFTNRYDRELGHRLGRVQTPTLVLDAEEDRVLGPGDAARYAELIPGAEYAVLPGPSPEERSSHVLHVEQPRAVAQAITAHIRSTTAESE